MKIIRFINKPIFQYKISSCGRLPCVTVFFSISSILPFSFPEALGTQDSRDLVQGAELKVKEARGRDW